MKKVIISKKIEIPEILPIDRELLDILRSIRSLRNRYVERVERPEENIATINLFTRLEDFLISDHNWYLINKLEIETDVE